jgi:predicted nucleic acid-binding protein
VIVVSNSTPLITLAKVGYFDLLQKLFAEVTISHEVWEEVVVRGDGQPGERPILTQRTRRVSQRALRMSSKCNSTSP